MGKKNILKIVIALNGGRVHEAVKNGLQNQGIEETGRQLYRKYNLSGKSSKITKLSKLKTRVLNQAKLRTRVLNQEEILCLVQKYFEDVNIKSISEFLTIPNKGARIPQFQFTTDSVDKLIPIVGNTVHEKTSLDVFLKVWSEEKIPNYLRLRSGKLKAIPTLMACNKAEKVGQTTHLALRMSKKLLFLIGLALIVTLVIAIFLFVSQQKKMMEANKKIMEATNQKIMEEANQKILGLQKKISGCNAEKALQFIENSKKIEKIPGLEKTVSEKTASLKRLMEKLKNVCQKNQYVYSECREFDPRPEKELREIRAKWFEDLNKIPEYGHDDKF